MARFIDAPAEVRCTATITLRDGSTAQCGRRRHRTGAPGRCWQHQEADVDPCPKGDPDCETGDDGSCHDGCEAPVPFLSTSDAQVLACADCAARLANGESISMCGIGWPLSLRCEHERDVDIALRSASTDRHPTAADVAFVEEQVGMGAGAWDMVRPREIVSAAWRRLDSIRAAALTPPSAPGETTEGTRHE